MTKCQIVSDLLSRYAVVCMSDQVVSDIRFKSYMIQPGNEKMLYIAVHKYNYTVYFERVRP